MEGPEPPLSPGEIRLLRLLLRRTLERRVYYGTTFGPRGPSAPVSVELETALSHRDFAACGQPLPEPETLAPTPVEDFICRFILYGTLFVTLIYVALCGVVFCGPGIVNFARKVARFILRLFRRYFATRDHAA